MARARLCSSYACFFPTTLSTADTADLRGMLPEKPFRLVRSQAIRDIHEVHDGDRAGRQKPGFPQDWMQASLCSASRWPTWVIIREVRPTKRSELVFKASLLRPSGSWPDQPLASHSAPGFGMVGQDWRESQLEARPQPQPVGTRATPSH